MMTIAGLDFRRVKRGEGEKNGLLNKSVWFLTGDRVEMLFG
ncbi:hypothetical protein FlaCF_1733 [Flavobacterium tructae]